MFQDQQQFSFLCNPAAWMHAGWQLRLPLWDVPSGLADVLWANRSKDGVLSRFLADRFDLHPTPMLDLEEETQKILLMEASKFEICLTRLGTVFLHVSLLNILDGAALRRVKKEFGDDDFHFMRHEAQNFIEVKSDARPRPSPPPPPPSKHHALLMGLAAFLKKLPARTDLLTRLWFKLPPFADEPGAPEGFMQLRAQLDQIGVLQPEAMNKIFNGAEA